ncbi:MAG: hypothetical protein ABI091_27445 [Ferruginibacter sp.]
MGTLILAQASGCVNDLMETLEIPSQKSASNLKKLIMLSTEHENVLKSNKLLDSFKKINDSLTESNHEISDQLLAETYDIIKHALTKINSMFNLVNKIFQFDGVDGAEVTIDDANMLEFLSNMAKSKRLMDYILNYVKILRDINKNSVGESKQYNVSDLNELFKVA